MKKTTFIGRWGTGGAAIGGIVGVESGIVMERYV